MEKGEEGRKYKSREGRWGLRMDRWKERGKKTVRKTICSEKVR